MGKKTSASFNEVFKGIAAGVAAVYVLAILCFFPFYTRDYYFNILLDRFSLYWKGTLFTGVVLGLLFLLYVILDCKENAGMNIKAYLGSLKPKNFVRRLSPTDWCFLALIAVMLISMAASGYPYESFWGNRGRWQGVLCWLMYGLTYIIITRYYRYQPWHLRAFLFAGMLVCLWGITDFFKLNLMHFLDEVPDGQANIFVSSVGNINTYTNLTAVIFALAAVLFVTDKKPSALVYDLLATVIAAFACIMGVSDNVVFAFAGFFAFLPFWAWRTRRGVVRYFIVLAVAFTAMAVTGALVSAGFDNISNYIGGSFFISFGQSAAAPLLAVFCWAVSAGLYGFAVSQSKGQKGAGAWEGLACWLDQRSAKAVRIGWAVFFVAALLAVLAVIIDANSGRHQAFWQPFANALIFNDDWGTHRGHNWRLAWEYFTQDESWLKRIIGHGPDTYYIITMDNYYHDMISKYGEVYDSAHNEYLNYLMTIGIAGLAAYLGMMGSGIYSVFQKKGVKAETADLHVKTENAGLRAKTQKVVEETKTQSPALGVWADEQQIKKAEEEPAAAEAERAVQKASAADLSQGAAACAFAAITYASQALINIAVPITLPIVFAIVFIGFSIARNGERQE